MENSKLAINQDEITADGNSPPLERNDICPCNALLPKKRNRKCKILTDEEIEKKKQKRMEYHKMYYQQNKKKINNQNKIAWKKRKQFLLEMGKNKQVLEFYEKLQASKDTANLTFGSKSNEPYSNSL